MKTTVLSILFILGFSTCAYSSEEGYFGKYTSINSGIKIEFTINEKGVSNLKINNINVNSSTLTYDYLAIYSGSQVFQINFDDNEKCSNDIKLFIVKSDEDFIIATGYYLQYKMSDKGKLVVIQKQALELAYKNI